MNITSNIKILGMIILIIVVSYGCKSSFKSELPQPSIEVLSIDTTNIELAFTNKSLSNYYLFSSYFSVFNASPYLFKKHAEKDDYSLTFLPYVDYLRVPEELNCIPKYDAFRPIRSAQINFETIELKSKSKTIVNISLRSLQYGLASNDTTDVKTIYENFEDKLDSLLHIPDFIDLKFAIYDELPEYDYLDFSKTRIENWRNAVNKYNIVSTRISTETIITHSLFPLYNEFIISGYKKLNKE